MSKLENIKRIRIKVNGIVQGVGFRLITYRYAHDFNLKGFVVNTPDSVTIEVEGLGENIDKFIKKLLNNPPSLAKITSFDVEDLDIVGDSYFIIH